MQLYQWTRDKLVNSGPSVKLGEYLPEIASMWFGGYVYTDGTMFDIF